MNLQESGLPCWAIWYTSLSLIYDLHSVNGFRRWDFRTLDWSLLMHFWSIWGPDECTSQCLLALDLRRTEVGRVTFWQLLPHWKVLLPGLFSYTWAPLDPQLPPHHLGQNQKITLWCQLGKAQRQGKYKKQPSLCQMVHWGWTIGEWIPIQCSKGRLNALCNSYQGWPPHKCLELLQSLMTKTILKIFEGY